MFPILPLHGWLQFQGVAPVLPSWYTEYYSQEDRLKALAKILNRLIKWAELVLDKINDLVEALNNLNERVEWLEDQINDILQRLEILEQEIVQIKQRLTTLENKVQNLENRMDNVENRLDTVENDILQLFTDIGLIEGRLDTVESKLDTLWNLTVVSDSNITSIEETYTEGNFQTIRQLVERVTEGDQFTTKYYYVPFTSDDGSVGINSVNLNKGSETVKSVDLSAFLVAPNEATAIVMSNNNPERLVLYPLDQDLIQD